MKTNESLTPDAALLAEWDNAVAFAHLDLSDHALVVEIGSKLAQSLRAALDREQEMRSRLDTRDRQMSDNMYLSMLEVERLTMRQRAEQAEAALAQQYWQPIETAPKDGAPFIGGQYHRIYGWLWGRVRWYWYDDKNTKGGGYFTGDVQPTHWHILPAAPRPTP